MRSSITAFGVLMLFAGTVSTSSAAPRQVRVTAANVNIRSKPSVQSEVMDQSSSGEIFTVLAHSDDGDWLRIKPPERIDAWVYGELVRDSEVAVSRLRVRSGPGINYTPIGTLNSGTKLIVRGEQGDWLKIAPPAVCTVWINAKYTERFIAVEPDVSDESRTQKSIKPHGHVDAATPSEYRPSSPEVKASTPEGTETLLPDWAESQALTRFQHSPTAKEAQGPVSTYIGVLRPIGMMVWRKPSRYRLISRDARGRAVTRCYLRGDEALLESFKGKRVEVSGAEHRVQGVKRPVMVVESISELASSATRPR